MRWLSRLKGRKAETLVGITRMVTVLRTVFFLDGEVGAL